MQAGLRGARSFTQLAVPNDKKVWELGQDGHYKKMKHNTMDFKPWHSRE